jgi:hypothetical protein
MPQCISSSTKKLIPLRVGNTRIDQLIFNPQVVQLTCRFGAPTQTGGNLSKLKEKTLSTQEVKSLMLLEVSTMKTKTLS